MLDFFQLYSIYIHACMAVGCDYMLCIDICVHSYSVHKCALGNALAKIYQLVLYVSCTRFALFYSITVIYCYHIRTFLPHCTMHKRGLCCRTVSACTSVTFVDSVERCLPVRPSRSWTLSNGVCLYVRHVRGLCRTINISSKFFHRRAATPF